MAIKKFLILMLFAAFTTGLVCGCQSSKEPEGIKYVFVLIGDGFGPNQRMVGELAAGKTLLMNTFPSTVKTGTNEYQGNTTDSAASGTAIACGSKTYNGAIAMSPDKQKLTSLAKELKQQGFSIGIISSCALTDATPACQYANQEKRSMRKAISTDMANSNFDFFGGGNLSSCAEQLVNNDTEKEYRAIVGQNYEIVFDINEVKTNSEKPYYLISPPHTCNKNCKANCDGVDLAKILTKAIDVLSTHEKGFYIMLECGRIDHAGHANDAGVTAKEVQEFDQAIGVALEFQKKHPAETLIVVTADHETGGLQIDDMEKLKANAKILLGQNGYITSGIGAVDALINKKAKAEDVYKAVCDHLGYNGFTAEEKAQLIGLIETNYAPEKAKIRRFNASQILKKAAEFRDQFLGIRYTTGGHSSAKIITNVSGPGWELFQRDDLENSSLKGLIKEAMAK